MARSIFALCVMLLLGISLFGRECYGLAMGPSRFEVSLPQGETAGADYYVQNDTEGPILVVVEPENWFVDAYDYKDLPVDEWIEFDTYKFELKPKEIKKLKLTIKVPADRTGELVAQIFFGSTPIATEEGSGGSLQARLGAVLYVAIKGTEKVDAEVRGINFSTIFEDDKKALKMEMPVWNKGNVHLRPLGQVAIEDVKGNKIDEVAMISGRAVLPNQTFSYSAMYKGEELKPGTYKATCNISYGEVFGMEKNIALEKAFEIDKNGEVVRK